MLDDVFMVGFVGMVNFRDLCLESAWIYIEKDKCSLEKGMSLVFLKALPQSEKDGKNISLFAG